MMNHTAAAPAPVIGLCTPLSVELSPIARALGLQPAGGWWRHALPQQRVVAGVAGMGGQRVAACLETLVREHGATRLVLAGFAGALDPDLEVGWIVLPTVIRTPAGVSWELREDAPPAVVAQPSAPPERTLLAVEQIVSTPAEKTRLHQQHSAAAVDMESHAAAQTAARLGVPLTVVRAVSDRADEALPAWTSRCVKADGSNDVTGALRHLLTHPHHVGTLRRLARNGKIAGAALAYWIAGKMEQWAGVAEDDAR